MPAKRNDPGLKRLALRMRQGGLGYWTVGTMLGIAHTTVKWYEEHPGEHDPEMPEPLATVERPICFVCHGLSPTWDGHDACRGRKGKAA